MIVKLVCAIVERTPSDLARLVGDPFEVEIDDGDSVSALKDAITKSKSMASDSQVVRLILAKKNDKWLTENDIKSDKTSISNMTHLSNTTDPLRAVNLSDKDVQTEVSGEEVTAGNIAVHVMVVVPKPTALGKRTRVDEYYADQKFVQVKKIKVEEYGEFDEDDEDDEEKEDNDKKRDVLRYFRMSKFPLLAHPEERFNTIVERESFIVIYKEMMGNVRAYFQGKTTNDIIVTGNPGIGKSRFYLYCIFRLLYCQDDVKDLFPCELMLNFGDKYHLYCPKDKVFKELSGTKAWQLSNRRSGLRLIDGTSSQLVGWKGMSILFTSSGLQGLRQDIFAKTAYTYYLPPWGLGELKTCNSLLSDELKLSDDVLLTKYIKFGGIPRFIFAMSESENDQQVDEALHSSSMQDIISLMKRGSAVKEGHFSQRIFAMVPSTKDFHAKFHLDFLSMYITEKMMDEASGDSLHVLAEFAMGG